MKRLALGLLLAGVLLMLAGCQTDKKQAESIRGTLDEAVPMEKEFQSGQEALTQEREKVQAIYGKVLAMENTDTGAIRQLAGKHEVAEELKLLKTAQADFKNVHEKIGAIQKTVDGIKDGDQKEEAAKLVKLENDRKKAMDTYFAAYQDQLETETAFFDHLEQGQFDLKVIDDQVHHINDDSGKMGEAIEQFNAYTKQFNDAQQTYFNMAGLD
ncbi:YkyA family protein [Sporosarcina koreensis]|uniref:YkyA family protein n=1 Tax=Sporosarcina koreensis TaxID=334735 RepID=UPI00058E9BCD|nr:YkyA family protein [Sporosarcina koreensis]